MHRDAPKVLLGLADLYRRSAAGSHGGARDFICDYEQLLRHAGCHDGDDREKAEDDLKRAEFESNRVLSLDRAARSQLFLRVRLSKAGGESWLFERIGESAPRERRENLAEFFNSMVDQPVPEHWQDDWRKWCGMLEEAARIHGVVQPFKRDDPEGNQVFLGALLGVIRWQGDSLIRFASSVICGNSKTLENLESRLIAALRSIRNDNAVTLEDFGILRKPRTLTFHGPLVLKLGGGNVDFSPLPGPCRISELDLIAANEIQTSAPLCLTVENEEVFLELAKQNPGWLLVHTSFPGSAVRRLFQRLPPDLPCWHFGDSDPAGFDILRDLREKTGRVFHPVCMEFRPDSRAPDLTAEERKTIQRLLSFHIMEDVMETLGHMLEAGSKGIFEQESLPVTQVFEVVATAARRIPQTEKSLPALPDGL